MSKRLTTVLASAEGEVELAKASGRRTLSDDDVRKAVRRDKRKGVYVTDRNQFRAVQAHLDQAVFELECASDLLKQLDERSNGILADTVHNLREQMDTTIDYDLRRKSRAWAAAYRLLYGTNGILVRRRRKK